MAIKVSKSQTIRDYLKSVHPSKRGPKAVCEALKAKGIEATPALVSQVKSSFLKKKKRNKSSSKNEVKKTSNNWETWVLAKNLLNSVGGNLTEAKKNLEIISKLLS